VKRTLSLFISRIFVARATVLYEGAVGFVEVLCRKLAGHVSREVHEDLGLFGYDGKRKKFVFRQFHVESFVNEYVEQEITADGKTLRFITERIENIPDGWRGLETCKILSQDEYAEVFELAAPQKEFEIYSESHWKRAK
jgi:hypothetical protein